MLNHLAPLETQNCWHENTVFMQTLKVSLELSEKLKQTRLYSNKKYGTKQKQPPEAFLEILQISLENTCARVSF